MPNDGALLNHFIDWVPDPAVRQKILVDNPEILFSF
jgi:2-pyrone-4,6-dicarboxylate lactonase